VIVFPAAASLVSAIFAIQLLTQYAHKKRLPQLAWGIAMTMYAVASLAVAAGVSGGWDPTLFRVYWLFGALLNVPYLALGSVALLQRKPLVVLMVLLVFAATLIAVVAVASSSVHLPANAGRNIPRGSRAWGKEALVAKLATYLSIPAYLLVVLIAFASGRGRKLPVHRIRGNWLIAAGATVVAAGSSVARYGRGSVFSVFLAVGVIVMFLGFRLASRAPHPAAAADEGS
jgi:drug/metabolite transporter (DMT)-like permease